MKVEHEKFYNLGPEFKNVPENLNAYTLTTQSSQATLRSHSSICLISGSEFSSFPRALHSANSTLIGFKSVKENSLFLLPRYVLLLLDVVMSCRAADLVTLRVFLK